MTPFDRLHVAVEDRLGVPIRYLPPGGGVAVAARGSITTAPAGLSLDGVYTDAPVHQTHLVVRQALLTPEAGGTVEVLDDAGAVMSRWRVQRAPVVGTAAALWSVPLVPTEE